MHFAPRGTHVSGQRAAKSLSQTTSASGSKRLSAAFWVALAAAAATCGFTNAGWPACLLRRTKVKQNYNPGTPTLVLAASPGHPKKAKTVNGYAQQAQFSKPQLGMAIWETNEIGEAFCTADCG